MLIQGMSIRGRGFHVGSALPQVNIIVLAVRSPQNQGLVNYGDSSVGILHR